MRHITTLTALVIMLDFFTVQAFAQAAKQVEIVNPSITVETGIIPLAGCGKT